MDNLAQFHERATALAGSAFTATEARRPIYPVVLSTVPAFMKHQSGYGPSALPSRPR